jgi:hypothetical protein
VQDSGPRRDGHGGDLQRVQAGQAHPRQGRLQLADGGRNGGGEAAVEVGGARVASGEAGGWKGQLGATNRDGGAYGACGRRSRSPRGGTPPPGSSWLCCRRPARLRIFFSFIGGAGAWNKKIARNWSHVLQIYIEIRLTVEEEAALFKQVVGQLVLARDGSGVLLGKKFGQHRRKKYLSVLTLSLFHSRFD